MTKKKKDVLDFVMENTAISAGTMVGAGLVGKLGTQLPSSYSNKIIGGMDTMSMIPTLHATGGVFNQLQGLNKTVKKKRR